MSFGFAGILSYSAGRTLKPMEKAGW